LGSAIATTDEAMHEIGHLPKNLRIQYYLNGLPLWRELETLHAQLDQNDHSIEVLETAKAIADSTPWKEITKAEAGFAARISNAQTWWREQHKPAPTGDEAAKEVTARPLPPAPPGIGHYRLLRDIAADVTVQTLEHMKFADLPRAVAAIEVSSFIDDDGHFSLGKVAECAGNLSGLWAFHDAHTSDEVGQAIIPEMLTKTTHAFDAILSGTLGKRPALLFGELTSHLHSRLTHIAGRTIELAAEPAKRAQSGKISFLVERRAATASLQ
jgi:hypothetical protein